MENYISKLTRKQLENKLVKHENKLSQIIIENDIDDFIYFACNFEDTKAIFNIIINENELKNIAIIRLFDTNDSNRFITIFIDNNTFESNVLRGHFYSTYEEPKPVISQCFFVNIEYDSNREVMTISHI